MTRRLAGIVALAVVAFGVLWSVGVLRPSLAAAQGYSPESAVKKMVVPKGLEGRLVASEPVVRQPVAIEFDDRGRLWAIQYLQYPNPAGLKRVKVDRFSRTVYDRVPEPPPHGPKGADRISILVDADGDGRADKAKDFLAGLNLATGLAFGHGGVFVLQAPYLLYYPDRDGDDVPDGDPEVIVKGFGMEDAHSVANSLTWGPDGWLYGCQGSTVTAKIDGRIFQQGVWRYHPVKRKFELFCDGGGNSWGLDFDRNGQLFYSTNFGPHVMLHGVQGGYYWKYFPKHGAFQNRFTYGYFDHMPHANFKGGHVTAGGVVYRGPGLPAEFQDKVIGADVLGHNVYAHRIEPRGSSFRSAFVSDLLISNDTWFAPCDVTIGPDGGVYVADWHDQRTAHPDPDAEWDRRNGRVYRVALPTAPRVSVPDWKKLTSEQLVQMLGHDNAWLARRALRILGERRDPAVHALLRKRIDGNRPDEAPLESLWALYQTDGLSEGMAIRLLEHPAPMVRHWVVRFMGDERMASPPASKAIIDLARKEPDVRVRMQLACSARLFPPALGVPIVRELVKRDLDASDPYIPLLCWWAVEAHATADRAKVTAELASPEIWKSRLARETILPRLIRRYASEPGDANLAACKTLFETAPPEEYLQMVMSFDQGLQERPTKPGESNRRVSLPEDVKDLILLKCSAVPSEPAILRFMMRLGNTLAEESALKKVADESAVASARVALLQVIGEVGESVAPLLGVVRGTRRDDVQRSALAALANRTDPMIGAEVLDLYPRLGPTARNEAITLLASRPAWAKELVRGAANNRIDPKEVTVEQLRPLASYNDPALDAEVRKIWGAVRSATPEEKLADVRRLNNDVRAFPGDPQRGKVLFTKLCSACHALFGEGGKIGPDLTHANRKDRDFLLVSLVDPSAVIRKEYQSFTVTLRDGRVLTGLAVDQGDKGVALYNAKAEATIVPRAQIEEMRESPISLMPDNLWRDLRPEELRDLFSYLQK